MARFSDEILAEFALDPKRELYWCTCPWCSGTILWGFRKDRPQSQGMAGTTLVHTTLLPETGKKSVTIVVDQQGQCPRFADLAATNSAELLKLLGRAGAKMHKND
jgi:hypothetical protein